VHVVEVAAVKIAELAVMVMVPEAASAVTGVNETTRLPPAAAAAYDVERDALTPVTVAAVRVLYPLALVTATVSVDVEMEKDTAPCAGLLSPVVIVRSTGTPGTSVLAAASVITIFVPVVPEVAPTPDGEPPA
jgi:hypothetical protein